jgi:putative ABC transport system permease protein
VVKFGIKSPWNRRFVAALTILSIALSVALLLGVERLRSEAKAGFANAASGIDLIVALRGNQIQILLATLFGVGSIGAALSWDSFEMVRDVPRVRWAVSVSMGDNHRGFPVIGTDAAYFEHFRHSRGRALEFAHGGVFVHRQDAVIGAELAARFGYSPGAEILVAHGSGAVSFHVHDEAPFKVSGVLKPTGTAVDRMLFVSLVGFDGLHQQREPVAADPLAGLEDARDPGAGQANQDHDSARIGHHRAHHGTSSFPRASRSTFGTRMARLWSR